MNYQKIAKEVVLDYANKHIDKTSNVQITLDDVYVVWLCKTLQTEIWCLPFRREHTTIAAT